MALACTLICGGSAFSALPANYKGTPFTDSVYHEGAQTIPGRVRLSYYDLGGEGVAYHDADVLNHGSGSDNKTQPCTDSACNALPPYLCFFRANEAVDMTAPKCIFDFFKREGTISPPSHENFVEFTVKGEWVNCTVHVKTRGTYRIGALYGIAIRDSLFISLNNNPKAGKIIYPKGTGGAHFWVYSDTLGTISFPDTGLNLLTFNFAGGENLNYLTFNLVGTTGISDAGKIHADSFRPSSSHGLAKASLINLNAIDVAGRRTRSEMKSYGTGRLKRISSFDSIADLRPNRFR